MFIQTETTPNPRTMKFLPGREVLEGQTRNYTARAEAAESPLAAELFRIPSVEGVFLGQDFITVTRAESADWPEMKPAILTAIMDHFMAGKPMLTGEQPRAAASDEGESDLVKQIKELIETRVRPAVAMDGGDIVYRGFENGVVKLELHGSCSGCPSSTITLKQGIESMLKHYVPEVIAVEAVA